MLIGVQFKTFTKDGEEYSSRFGFFNDVYAAKRAAITLYESDDNIYSVEATDVESGKVIKHVPDRRGGIRYNGGRKAFDGKPRPHKLSFRVSDDVWRIITSSPDRGEFIHKAVRFYHYHQQKNEM